MDVEVAVEDYCLRAVEKFLGGDSAEPAGCYFREAVMGNVNQRPLDPEDGVGQINGVDYKASSQLADAKMPDKVDSAHFGISNGQVASTRDEFSSLKSNMNGNADSQFEPGMEETMAIKHSTSANGHLELEGRVSVDKNGNSSNCDEDEVTNNAGFSANDQLEALERLEASMRKDSIQCSPSVGSTLSCSGQAAGDNFEDNQLPSTDREYEASSILYSQENVEADSEGVLSTSKYRDTLRALFTEFSGQEKNDTERARSQFLNDKDTPDVILETSSSLGPVSAPAINPALESSPDYCSNVSLPLLQRTSELTINPHADHILNLSQSCSPPTPESSAQPSIESALQPAIDPSTLQSSIQVSVGPTPEPFVGHFESIPPPPTTAEPARVESVRLEPIGHQIVEEVVPGVEPETPEIRESKPGNMSREQAQPGMAEADEESEQREDSEFTTGGHQGAVPFQLMIGDTVDAVRQVRAEAARLAFRLAEKHAQDAMSLRQAAGAMQLQLKFLHVDIQGFQRGLDALEAARWHWGLALREFLLLCTAVAAATRAERAILWMGRFFSRDLHTRQSSVQLSWQQQKGAAGVAALVFILARCRSDTWKRLAVGIAGGTRERAALRDTWQAVEHRIAQMGSFPHPLEQRADAQAAASPTEVARLNTEKQSVPIFVPLSEPIQSEALSVAGTPASVQA